MDYLKLDHINERTLRVPQTKRICFIVSQHRKICSALSAIMTISIDRQKTITFEIHNVVINPASKVHVNNMGPTWVLSAVGGPRVGPTNPAIRETAKEICPTF